MAYRPPGARGRPPRSYNFKPVTTGKGFMNHHDENGIHMKSGLDLCDCLDKNCVGCHYPCKHCRSQKCGQICRNNRKRRYEEVIIEGTDLTYKHPARTTL